MPIWTTASGWSDGTSRGHERVRARFSWAADGCGRPVDRGEPRRSRVPAYARPDGANAETRPGSAPPTLRNLRDSLSAGRCDSRRPVPQNGPESGLQAAPHAEPRSLEVKASGPLCFQADARGGRRRVALMHRAGRVAESRTQDGTQPSSAHRWRDRALREPRESLCHGCG